jgi:predicted thioesterase
MPQVYATPMMILHMEMASGSAIASYLPAGFVSVGMEVKVRYLAATPVGRTVHIIEIDAKSVEAWNGVRKIGDGAHRRGIVNVVEFEKRFSVRHSPRPSPEDEASGRILTGCAALQDDPLNGARTLL